ncbi:calcium-binding protein [Nocardioides terrigena]|uniref:calcium-binding protein n=1 Tax=Nocardioides terrigena TaxID=424797 RepID=UPI00131F08CC|nr:calcium-binding protein [Nocardioides terrigena]
MLNRSTALTATTLLTAAFLTAAPATAIGETCQGRPATIVGTGADVLGTPGDDVIVTGASKTTDAGDGNDLICVTGSAGDEIYADAGRGDDSVDASTSLAQSIITDLDHGLDRYVGSRYYDRVLANGTDDHIEDTNMATLSITEPVTGPVGSYTGDYLEVWSSKIGIGLELDNQIAVGDVPGATIADFYSAHVSAPNVELRGNPEDNTLSANGCDIRINGEDGNDYISAQSYPGDGAPTFECASSARLSGGGGDDVLEGGRGKDRLVGNAGRDRLRGGDGSDLLIGGSGRDVLEGENGKDVLRGNAGSDRMNGGHGRDTLSGNRGPDTANGDKGRDQCVAEIERRCEV